MLYAFEGLDEFSLLQSLHSLNVFLMSSPKKTLTGQCLHVFNTKMSGVELLQDPLPCFFWDQDCAAVPYNQGYNFCIEETYMLVVSSQETELTVFLNLVETCPLLQVLNHPLVVHILFSYLCQLCKTLIFDVQSSHPVGFDLDTDVVVGY